MSSNEITGPTRGLARRDMLKGTLAGAAAVLGFPTIIPASALGAEGAVAPSDRITLASIGVGRMGGGDTRAFLQQKDVRVVAVCDVQESRRNAQKDIVDRTYGDKACATYNDFRELLERQDVDALMLATGERWTPLIGAEAARRGKHMYYEKPLALTVENAKAIREVIRRSGVAWQFGTQQRSSQYFRFAVELVRNGKIGNLQKVVIGSSVATAALSRRCPNRYHPASIGTCGLAPRRWSLIATCASGFGGCGFPIMAWGTWTVGGVSTTSISPNGPTIPTTRRPSAWRAPARCTMTCAIP